MLQNARITAFTVSEFLREDQKGGVGGGGAPPPPPLSTQIRVNIITSFQIFGDLQDLFEDLRIYKEKVSMFYIQ